MRIGIFTDAYAPAISGVVTSVNMLKKGLEEQGHEVIIVTTSYRKNKEEPVKNVIRFKGMNVPLKALRDYQLVSKRKLRIEAIAELNLDVIHVHTEFSIGRFGVRAAKKLGIPLVYTTHTMYEDYMHHVIPFCRRLLRRPYMWYVRKVLRWFVGDSTYTITPNQKVIDMFKRYGIEKDFKLIPTGLDLNRFRKEQYTKEQVNKLKRSYGVENDFVVLCIGRVAKEKSIDFLIKEFANDKIKSIAKFVIVGDGPARKSLEELVQKLNIVSRVVFTGAVPWDEIGLYYQLGDVFVNASVTETQGLTYIEALAASLPIIVRHDINLEEFVKDGYNGIFYNDAAELSDALQKIVYDKELRGKLVNNSTKSIEKYSVLQYSNNVIKLYEEAVKSFKEQKKAE